MRMLAGILMIAVCVAAQAQDVEGSADHPLITRYPGSVIQS